MTDSTRITLQHWAPDDPYNGEVRVRSHFPPDGSAHYLTIEHADPWVLVTDELLTVIAERDPDDDRPRWLRLEMPERKRFGDPTRVPSATNFLIRDIDLSTGWVDIGTLKGEIAMKPTPDLFTDALLHIDARNRHLIYRIGQHRLMSNVWEAAWPD